MEVTRSIVLPVTRDEAWEALTEPERLREWLANDVELDVTLADVTRPYAAPSGKRPSHASE